MNLHEFNHGVQKRRRLHSMPLWWILGRWRGAIDRFFRSSLRHWFPPSLWRPMMLLGVGYTAWLMDIMTMMNENE
jgi:hypothetical protein